MKRTFFTLLIVSLLSLGLFNSRIQAQSNDSYTYYYLSPINVQNTGDLSANLDKEVKKVIQAGHLAPFRTLYGEEPPAYHWYHRYDSVYTLSLAYPYLPASTQTLVKQYLATELANYPVWSATLLDLQTGFKREPDELSSTERGNYSLAGYASRPKLFALYALWLYAHQTGDWTLIDNNWSSITSFYSSYRTETSSYYSSIAGAIGMARMAQHRNASSQLTTAVSDIATGLTNGKNYDTFGLNAENAYKGGLAGDWSGWTRSELFLGFHLLDITPEIGRYFRDNPTLVTSIIGSSRSNQYSLSKAEYFWPLWYMAQAPHWTRYYGEGSGTPPDAKAMIFPIKNWVQKEPASKLRTYLDVPDALVGDFYYMQNVVRTIEASGTECWEDVRTSAAECVSGGTITPTPMPTATVKEGDANGDAVVDGIDYLIWRTNYNQLKTGPSFGDFNNSGKVDGVDYLVWRSNYGK